MVCITRTHFSRKCEGWFQIPPKNMESLEESGDLHGMLEPKIDVGKNNWGLQEPIQMQRLKVFSAPCSAPAGGCFGNRSAISGFLLRSDSFTGGIPKSENMPRDASRQTRKLGGGEVVCKPQPPWSWLPCYPKKFSHAPPLEKVDLTHFDPWTLMWTLLEEKDVIVTNVQSSSNWEQKHVEMTGDNVLDVKKYHGMAFLKYSTSGWDSSKRNPPPRTKTATQLLSLAGLFPFTFNERAHSKCLL